MGKWIGKTLLMRIAHGLLMPTRKNFIRLIRKTRFRETRTMVFQKPIMLRRTVKKTYYLHSMQRKDQIIKDPTCASWQVNLSHKANAQPPLSQGNNKNWP